jgi:hypothetical protein
MPASARSTGNKKSGREFSCRPIENGHDSMQLPGAIGRDHGGRSVLEGADDLPSGRCSSAVLAFVPEIATVFWRRWIRGE